jgi:hypothetical protein
MKILILMLALVSSSVFAVGYKSVKSSFTVSEFSGNGNRTYYSCDSVEYETEAILKVFGAKNISVRCSGGINPTGGFHTSARVRTNYDVLSYEVEGNMTVAIENDRFDGNNCHLADSIVRGVEKKFEISNLRSRSCFRSSDRTRITFDVLKESI